MITAISLKRENSAARNRERENPAQRFVVVAWPLYGQLLVYSGLCVHHMAWPLYGQQIVIMNPALNITAWPFEWFALLVMIRPLNGHRLMDRVCMLFIWPSVDGSGLHVI